MKKIVPITLIFVCTSIWAQIKPVATIPFTLEKSCIYFYCKVNSSDSLKFLFDTGADGSVINEQAKQKIPLKINNQSLNVGSNGTNSVSQSSDNTITFGNLTKSNIDFTIIPYGTSTFDGVFGTNLMTDHVIEIDYSKKELRFYEVATYNKDLSDYDAFKIYLPGNYVSIKGSIRIKGKRYSGLFGLDTGADNVLTLSSPFVIGNKLINKTIKIGASLSQGSDGSEYENPLVLVPEVSIGAKSFYRIPTDLSLSKEGVDAATDKIGFLGNNFLKRFNVVINLKRGFIYLTPNHNLYTDFF